jgi:acyl carrier protein
MEAQVRDEVTKFVVTNFLFGDAERAPLETDSLVEGGIIDSTGVLELIEFIESRFGIEVAEVETVPENLDSIARMAQFITRKQASPGIGG